MNSEKTKRRLPIVTFGRIRFGSSGLELEGLHF